MPAGGDSTAFVRTAGGCAFFIAPAVNGGSVRNDLQVRDPGEMPVAGDDLPLVREGGGSNDFTGITDCSATLCTCSREPAKRLKDRCIHGKHRGQDNYFFTLC